jgi:gag-polypeptide of LTR copia-type
MTSFLSFKGDKLIRYSNYIEWKNNTDLFLKINNYISYIDGSKSKPNKALYYSIKTSRDKESDKETSAYNLDPFSRELDARYTDRLVEFNQNNKHTLEALKSIISNNNNDRFKDKTNTKDLYDIIINTFSAISLELIGYYFDKIVDINYNSFNNMDKYTSNIQSSLIYLSKLG